MNAFKIHISSKSTWWHDVWIPITFHCVLEKPLGVSLSVLFKVCLLSKKNKQANTEAVVNSAAHCNSASKYHSCRLWMFSPYHQELILWAVFSFLAPEECTDCSQVIVLVMLYESNILTFFCFPLPETASVTVWSEPSW